MQVYKPGSVSSLRKRRSISIIYLSDLPISVIAEANRAGHSKTETYLAFQHPRFTICRYH